MAYLLKPRSSIEATELDSQICAIHRLVVDKRSPRLTADCQVGDRVTTISGPLIGLCGTVVGVGNARKLVVWVDILGIGVSVLLDPTCDLVRASRVKLS